MRLTALSLFLLSTVAASEELSSTSAPTPSASQSTFYIPITTLPPIDVPHLELRANPAAPVAPVAPAAPVAPVAPAAPAAPIPGGAGVPAAALTTVAPGATQAPTITTVMVNTVVGGVPKQVPVVYTQTFADVPSQGPSPLKGTIGLGTLTSKGGAKSTGGKAKRSEGGRSTRSMGVSVGVFAGVVGSIGGGLSAVLFG